jgi:hypothetical protein
MLIYQVMIFYITPTFISDSCGVKAKLISAVADKRLGGTQLQPINSCTSLKTVLVNHIPSICVTIGHYNF